MGVGTDMVIKLPKKCPNYLKIRTLKLDRRSASLSSTNSTCLPPWPLPATSGGSPSSVSLLPIVALLRWVSYDKTVSTLLWEEECSGLYTLIHPWGWINYERMVEHCLSHYQQSIPRDPIHHYRAISMTVLNPI